MANGVVYSTCGYNYLYAFDASNGNILWQYYTWGEWPMRASPAIADGKLYHAATFNFTLYAFDAPVAGVYLLPDSQSGETLPGENITYEVTLNNSTFHEDRFVIDYARNNWPTTLSMTQTPTMTNGSFITFH